MRIRTRLGLYLLVGLFSVWAGPSRAQAGQGRKDASLEKVRYWCSGQYTRVVFDLDRNAEYYVGKLQGDPRTKRPARIYVDLQNTLPSKGVAVKTDLAEGPVRTIRSGRHDRHTTRMVLDLRHAEDYNVFQLEGPFRIVLDLWWKKGGKGSRKGQDARGGASGAHRPRLPLIVLDPGHGGRDPGAIGKRGLKEKDVALRIARYVKNILERQKQVRVILTRDRDEFIPLERRAWIANSKGADLFVSIHANAHPNRKARGVETYYLDNTTDRAAMRVAAMENDTPAKRRDGLNWILIDLRCNANALESNDLAYTMQKAVIGKVRKAGYKDTRDLGVKGGLFYVLIGAHMPSILVETAFITNPAEEKRLGSRAYQKLVAEGVALGIKNYLRQHGRYDLLAKQ